MKAFAQGQSQTAAKGACGPGLPGLPASSAASLRLRLYFPLEARLSARLGLPPLSSLPHPLPSRKGQVRPSLPRACPFMAVLFQNVAKFINSPFPETRNHLCRVQRGGRAGSFVGGLDLSPGLGPMSPGVGWAPRPLPAPQFPHLQSKDTGLQIIPYVLPKSRHMQFTAYKGQFFNQGPHAGAGGWAAASLP